MEKTEEMKMVFYCNDKILGQKRRNLKKLGNLVSKNLGITIEIPPSDEFGNCIMYVPGDMYQKCLEVGTSFAVSYGLPVNWINIHNEVRPRDYISVMRGFFSGNENASSKMSEIGNYRYQLQRYLSGKSVVFMYNAESNSVDFLVKGTFCSSKEEFELLKKQCLGFNYTTDENPFDDMIFLEKDGTPIMDSYCHNTPSLATVSKEHDHAKLLEKKQ